jgi:hypothetical protein
MTRRAYRTLAAARRCSRAHLCLPPVPAAGRFGIYGVSDQG